MTKRNIQRDDALLNHVGQYGFSIRKVIARSVLSGANPGNVLRRLSRENAIVSYKTLPGSRSYYQLTPAEAAKRGFPESKAKILSGQILQERLAVLWACTMADTSRHLLSRSEIQTTIDSFDSKNPHCIERANKTHLISRIRFFSKREPADIARWLIKQVNEDLNCESLSSWVRARRYSYLLLVDDPSPDKRRVQKTKTAIKETGVGARGKFRVEFAPSCHSLANALKTVVDKKNRKAN